MRIAIIGPTHPYKGGIPQATTELAHRLKAQGHTVHLVSWKNMYPKILYPGQLYVPDDKPELPIFDSVERKLAWNNPVSWWREARGLRSYDQVIFVWWVPTIQGPVYLAMLKALGSRGPKTVLICHNVLAHEPKKGDKAITKAVLNRVDTVIVHSDKQQAIAKALTKKTVRVATLPAHLPGQDTAKKQPIPASTEVKHHLLFFGLVRKYKGVDVLLKALATVPDVSLTVAGEFRGIDSYKQLIEELGLAKRVTLQDGYVPAEKLGELFASADALVLPYRGGTGTQNVTMAFNYGIPAIATTSMATQVRNEIDGLLCKPDNVEDLTRAIAHFYEPGVATKLRAGVLPPNADDEWQAYLNALGDLGTDSTDTN